MEHFSEKRYPLNPTDYKLYEEVGDGVSATVYRALCIPLNEVVAIKVLDLEKCNNDLDGIRREVQTMTLTNHPNLLRALCSFTADHSLWVVMPFMAGGSCLHIMKSAHPDGFEEPVIATLLREVLKALVYLHGHGHIHRDVKAGNILVDVNGAVKLADFGVSACMFDTGDRQRSRNTFVGTPCWMAPEVMQQLHGYDFKADIWSFGITALELAHGHAPFSKYPPMKVLLMTLQNAPPGLDYERDKRFSKSFKAMVATCLVKDPKKRPNSEKLLKHPFFKQARSNEYLARNILDGLSPLGDRFRTVKAKEADFLLNNKTLHGNEVHLSQQEYIRGISGWNFNLEDLKTQASLIQSADGTVHLESNHKPMDARDEDNFAEEILSHDRVNHANAPVKSEDGPHHPPNFEHLLASSFPDRPLQALKGCFDVCDDENSASSPNWKDGVQSSSEPVHPLQQSLHGENLEYVKSSDENTERRFSVSKSFHVPEHPKFLSGSLLPEHVLSPSRSIGDAKRGDLRHKFQSERNYSAPLLYRQMKDAQTGTSATTFEETSEGRIVQSKGRFKVTSADACSKGIPSTNYSANPVSGALTNPTVFAASLLPSFQYVLQQNAMQREQLIKLIKYLEQISGQQSEPADVGSGDLSQISPASSRERELQAYLVHLQQSVGKLVEEVQKLNIQNAQLEQQVNSFFGKNKEETIQKEKETQR